MSIPHHHRDMIYELVTKLLAEAPKMEGAPADDPGGIEAQVILRSGFRAVGALTRMHFDSEPTGHCTTRIDCLKFLVIGKAAGREEMIACEHYFDYEDVECIVVMRAMTAPTEKPKIFIGHV